MFSIVELKNIDHTYFNVIHTGCYCVTLQSKNTKHYWHILRQQYPTFTSCKIWHKHKQSDSFHEQGNAPTLGGAGGMSASVIASAHIGFIVRFYAVLLPVSCHQAPHGKAAVGTEEKLAEYSADE